MLDDGARAHSASFRRSRRPCRLEKSLRWLLNNKGREGHWLWKWKFRTVDRQVQFDPDKYGWPWFPGTVSWVIPTAFSLIALKQSLACCRTEQVANRIQLGTEMLRDRACPSGGWNAGNGMVFGAASESAHRYNSNSAACINEDDAEAGRTSGAELAAPGLRRMLVRIQPCVVRARLLSASEIQLRSLHRASPSSAVFREILFPTSKR